MNKPALSANAGGVKDSVALTCTRCLTTAVPALHRSGPHIRADCPRCGCFIKFVVKNDTWLELLAEQERRRTEAQPTLFVVAP